MEQSKKILGVGLGFGGFLLFFILFLILLCCNSGGGNLSILAGTYFSLPLESSASYTISSEFGERVDPFDDSKTSFHTGIDLASGEGTVVIASADGTVVDTGFQDGGLGNYVYIEHNFSGLIFYTIYGHMLDESITVSEGQKVIKGEKIGSVGSTGNSTGNHLHFSITSPKLSFKKEYLIDPQYVIKGLD